MPTFPKGHFEAIQREKSKDREAYASSLVSLATYTTELRKKEKTLNNLYWSLFHRGKCEDEELALYCRDERNALRVRIMRCQKRLLQ